MVGDCFVDGVGGVDSKFDVEHREEFATAWRAAGKDYVVAVEVLKRMKHGGIVSERVCVGRVNRMVVVEYE